MEIADVRGPWYKTGRPAGNVEALGGAAENASQIRVEQVGRVEVARSNAWQVGSGKTGLACCADAECIGRYDATIVGRRQADELALKPKRYLVPSLQPIRVVLKV